MNVTVDMENDFFVTSVAESTRSDATANEAVVDGDYSVSGFFCSDGDIDDESTWIESSDSSTIIKGELLKICLQVLKDNVSPKILSTFEIKQGNPNSRKITTTMIGSGGIGSGKLVQANCACSKCMLQSLIPAIYFDDIDPNNGSPFDLVVEGNLELQFGPGYATPTGVRRSRHLEQNVHFLDGTNDGGASSKFNIDVKLMKGASVGEESTRGVTHQTSYCFLTLVLLVRVVAYMIV